ncbi:MAG TPA: trehalase family glycosidase [Candidatus Saccharimonadales bacterium]|nr:trehalase family glycosidase [Candidatus Saccharimonadales bacterium]
MNRATLIKTATEVLRLNDLGTSTRPTAKLYPHQWLWDSAFIAIGLRHLDAKRAQTEIRSLLKGQWHNGMIPYIIFGPAKEYHAGPSLWRSSISPNCPPGLQTTGGTQPPMIAEAVVRIGQSLSPKERAAWYKEVYPALARYHEWLYTARDPEGTGLVVLFHSWETGLDNTPPWMDMINEHALSRRLWFMDKSKTLIKFMECFRKDTSVVPANERMSTLELMALYDQVRQMRALHYDDAKLYARSKLLVQDIGMNSILVRATQHVGTIAKGIGKALPPRTAAAYKRGTAVLDALWDPESEYYYSKDLRTGKLVKAPTIASFLPLYAGTLPKARVQALRRHIRDPLSFNTVYPVPSTPVNSPYFKPHCYWQGPVWFNVNWLLIQGLRQNGELQEAEHIKVQLLKLVTRHGMYEYFSPLDGKPAGAPNFSWTAALTLELLNEPATRLPSAKVPANKRPTAAMPR